MFAVLIVVTMIFFAHAAFSLAMLPSREPRCAWCGRNTPDVSDSELCAVGAGCMQ